MSDSTVAWLTNGVQIGFVTGALLASLVNLPDIVRLNRLLAAASVLAAGVNVLLLLEPSPTAPSPAALRPGWRWPPSILRR